MKKKKRIYRGFLTRKEMEAIDDKLDQLNEIIPDLEKTLYKKYGKKTILYRHELGLKLNEFLNLHKISTKEKLAYWEDLKTYASSDENKTKDRKPNSNRSEYEECYIASKIDKKILEKLVWKKWQGLFDSREVFKEKRILIWIDKNDEISKIKNKTWRIFLRILRLYFRKFDTSIFNEDELFLRLDNVFMISNEHEFLKNHFSKTESKDIKINQKNIDDEYVKETINLIRVKNKENIKITCKEIYTKHYMVEYNKSKITNKISSKLSVGGSNPS